MKTRINDKNEVIKRYVGYVFCLSLLILASCNNTKNADEGRNNGETDDEVTAVVFKNPLDSILQSVGIWEGFDTVLDFLYNNTEFSKHCDSIGYYSDEEDCLLWKDCGEIRVFSIPRETIHSALGYNVVQINKGELDTILLNEITGRMDNLYQLKGVNGREYYILKTSGATDHQGVSFWENICAFSLDKGRLLKETLFQTKNKQYDNIDVECGGQRNLPLDYNQLELINCSQKTEVVIAEINEMDWPTGYGLHYKWNGTCFKYVGKIPYDAYDKY